MFEIRTQRHHGPEATFQELITVSPPKKIYQTPNSANIALADVPTAEPALKHIDQIIHI